MMAKDQLASSHGRQVAGAEGSVAGGSSPALPSDSEPVVTTSRLTRDYDGVGLFDVDLVVPRGSIYGLVGMNGAGKTTLLSLLSGLRRPDRGRGHGDLV